MNPWVRIFLMMAGVILFIFILSLIRARFPKRTLPDWGGRGVNDELVPPEVGILLGCLPGQIVASLAAWLAFRGKVRLRGSRPLDIEWVGPPPEGEVEHAFRAAIEGGHREEDYAEVLEALMRRTGRRMQDVSCRLTSLQYARFVDSVWEAAIEETTLTPGLEAWLVLRDVGRNWEKLKAHEDGRRIMRVVLISAALEKLLFTEAFLERSCAGATQGFFRYRRDLLRSRPYHRPSDFERRLMQVDIWGHK